MNSDIEILEFEWYLRDFFYRNTNSNTVSNTVMEYDNDTIAKNMQKNYLRYRRWELKRIKEFLKIIVTKLKTNGVIQSNSKSEQTKLLAQFIRNQCETCFFVNNLSIMEPKICMRCKSVDLVEFPIKNTK